MRIVSGVKTLYSYEIQIKTKEQCLGLVHKYDLLFQKKITIDHFVKTQNHQHFSYRTNQKLSTNQTLYYHRICRKYLSKTLKIRSVVISLILR